MGHNNKMTNKHIGKLENNPKSSQIQRDFVYFFFQIWKGIKILNKVRNLEPWILIFNIKMYKVVAMNASAYIASVFCGLKQFYSYNKQLQVLYRTPPKYNKQ